jgi:hypothetical protein
VFQSDNIIGGIGELDFFDNHALDQMIEPGNITGGIGELDFFDNP